MTAQELKNSILQYAVQGKLVPQNPNDEPAELLLQKIKTEKQQLVKEKKIKADKPLNPISEEEISFEIPDSWVWVRLGDIGITQTGTTPPTQQPEFFGNEIPFIKPADISFSGINYHNEGLTLLGSKKSRVVDRNSVMMVCIGGSIGKCFYNDRDVCFNQQINAITPLVADNKFLFYAMCSDSFFQSMLSKATGTATPIINKSTWSELLIPLPPLSEQHRIVQKIEELMPLVEAYDKAEKELTELNTKFPEQIKKSVLQYAIQGKLVPQNPHDEPASALLQKIKAEKAKLINEKKIKTEKPLAPITEEEIPFEIPESWEWVRFESINQLITCGYASTPKYVETGRPFLSAKNVKPFRFLPEIHNYISEELYHSLVKTTKPSKGDILLTRVGAGIGEAAIIDIDFDFAIYVSLTLIKPFQNYVFNKYILFWLASPLGFQSSLSNIWGKNASQGNLNVNKVREFLFPLPPLAEQHRIVEKVEEVLRVCDKLK